MSAGVDAVFRALGDHRRRRLLDALLRRDGQTPGDLCAALPALSRFAVMKHPRVREAGGKAMMRGWIAVERDVRAYARAGDLLLESLHGVKAPAAPRSRRGSRP